jgi:DNA processing protein
LSEACDSCLRRAYLVARLAPRIAGLLQRPPAERPSVLALGDEQLIDVLPGTADSALRLWLDSFDADAARAEVEAARCWVACSHASAYPGGLGQLADPPAALFGRGGANCLERLATEPSVTVVGTRSPSPYGMEIARALGRGLGAAGLPVVSGLALGIDAAAHEGCLEGGGTPIAVLAGGPDLPYPRRHRWLYERVRASGVVLSEMPPGRRAFRWSFPARNRIMAGLAAMTVVAEAAEPSGSLITADFARDLGRLVGAVPGRVTTRVAAGSNRLLQDGAAVVLAPEDVLDQLYGVGLRPWPRPKPAEPEDERLQAVLAAVEECRDPAEIPRRAGIGAAEARSALGRLESEGWIARDPLGGYERRAE